jgi:hypothetical protein
VDRNPRPLGESRDGFLPFEFEIGESAVFDGDNLLTVAVDSRHHEDDVVCINNYFSLDVKDAAGFERLPAVWRCNPRSSAQESLRGRPRTVSREARAIGEADSARRTVKPTAAKETKR